MLVYTPTITSRIEYIFQYLKEITGLSFELTESVTRYSNTSDPKINYSSQKITEKEYQIIPCGLLLEKGIRIVEIEINHSGGIPYFFKTPGTFPFDLPAAIFYLISRYEEYLPFKPDLYGRYPHENSLASKENFLNRPLVDEWMNKWAKDLQAFFPSIHLDSYSFRFLATYDIDIAWSYKNKGWIRNLGGILKSPRTFLKRIRVLIGKEKDPFDCYNTLYEVHKGKESDTLYFFPVAKQRSLLDKNIDPDNAALQQLIQTTNRKGRIGLHPSYYSHKSIEVLVDEKKRLEEIINQPVTISRQHYLKFCLPQTYRSLIDSGITDDYSMGYGTINGFRASTSRSFLWYDLENESATSLRIHPLAWMDANTYYEGKLSPEEALFELEKLYKQVSDLGGSFIIVSHNHLLGEKSEWIGWPELYFNCCKKITIVRLK